MTLRVKDGENTRYFIVNSVEARHKKYSFHGLNKIRPAASASGLRAVRSTTSRCSLTSLRFRTPSLMRWSLAWRMLAF